VRQPFLFLSPFLTLLVVMSLEGGYGQTEGIREKSMLFHDAASVEVWVETLRAVVYVFDAKLTKHEDQSVDAQLPQ